MLSHLCSILPVLEAQAEVVKRIYLLSLISILNFMDFTAYLGLLLRLLEYLIKNRQKFSLNKYMLQFLGFLLCY